MSLHGRKIRVHYDNTSFGISQVRGRSALDVFSDAATAAIQQRGRALKTVKTRNLSVGRKHKTRWLRLASTVSRPVD